MVMPKPRPPAPPPAPPEAPKPRAKAPAPRTPGEGKPKSGSGGSAPTEEAPPPVSDLKPLAPDEANLVVLLACDKLRVSPWRKDVEALMSHLPDYQVLITQTGLSLFDDFDALLLGTPEPREANQTFIAARFKESPRIRALQGRYLGRNDPRQFRFLREGLGVIARPDIASRLDASMARVDGGNGAWLAELEKLGKPDAKQPAVRVSLSDVGALMRFGGGLPTPLTLALATTVEASPAVRVRAVFRTPEEAAQMEAAWPGIVERYKRSTALLGLAPALDGIKLTRQGAELELAGRIPEQQLRLALSWARAAAPRPEYVPTQPDLDAGTRGQ
jgi:hypothetical protein